MAERGLTAIYPFSSTPSAEYNAANEERFRAQVAQANAEVNDRLASIETDVDTLQDAPPPVIPTVPAFATEPQAIDGTSSDTIISPETLAAVVATLTNLLVPTGAVMHFAGDAPAGWLLCDGAAVTATYGDLRAYLLDAGSPYGVSGADPRLPDLRGEFIRGADLGRGVDAGRAFGSGQLDQIQRITGQFNNIQFLGGADETVGVARRHFITNSAIWQGATNVARNTRLSIDTDFDPSIRDGAETRPRNVALRPCIKT